MLVLSLPHVSWRDLDRVPTPNLDRLLAVSAVANLTPRTLGRSELGSGYATLGAGTRAAGTRTVSDGTAFAVSEHFGKDTAGEVFTQRTGLAVDKGVVHLGVAPLREANRAEPVRVEVGALGDAIAEAGYSRAVIANADGTEPDLTLPYQRYAVSALMDSKGTVPGGRVDRELLVRNPAAPFGVQLDNDAVVEAFGEVWEPRSVVLVEGSELARAMSYAPVASAPRRAFFVRRALRQTDRLVGRLLERVDLARDAVVVVGPARTFGGALTIAALHAPELPTGFLGSPSTRRPGYVLLADVAPTIAQLVGHARPREMAGRPFTVYESDLSPAALRARLIEGSDAALFRDRVRGGVTNAYTALQALLVLGAAYVVLRRPGKRPRPWVRTGALASLALVPAVYLARLVPFHDVGVLAYGLALAAAACAGGSLYRALGRRNALDPLLLALGVVDAVLVIDVVTGARLQLSSAFGYAPTIGVRIAGFGNISYAFLSASAVLLAALIAHRVGGRRGVAFAAGVLAVVLVVDVAPFWGSDVGGILSLVPAFGVTAVLLVDRQFRFGARTWALLAAAVVAVGSAAVAVDFMLPAAERTHLGRLVERVRDDGVSRIAEVIYRKLDANFTTLTGSDWRPLVVVVLVSLAFLALVPPRPLRGITARVPELRASFAGFVVLALTGYAVNDSGITVPAVMLGVLNAVVVALVVGEREHVAPPGHAPAGPFRPRKARPPGKVPADAGAGDGARGARQPSLS